MIISSTLSCYVRLTAFLIRVQFLQCASPILKYCLRARNAYKSQKWSQDDAEKVFCKS